FGRACNSPARIRIYPLSLHDALPISHSAIWHGASSITGESPPTHAPASQASPAVQATPSSQAEPSGFSGSEHNPVAGSQTPSTWHVLRAPQTIGAPPTHAPAWQLSSVVQASPSLQVVPSSSTSWATPATGSQLSAVQLLPSSISGDVPP